MDTSNHLHTIEWLSIVQRMMKKSKAISTSAVIEDVSIESIAKDPANVRKHSQRNIEAIKASLTRFGQQKPIVIDADGKVLAGNGTLQAAIELQWATIQVSRSRLQGKDAVAFAIADNRSAELAEWDFEALTQVFEELQGNGFDLNDIGWQPHEIEPLMNSDFLPQPHNDGPESVRPINLTKEQREVFERAVNQLRDADNSRDMSEGRCVELLASRFLA